MSALTKYLSLNDQSNNALGEASEQIATVTEFLGRVADKLPDLIDKAKDSADQMPDLFSNAIEVAAPWLSVGVEAIGDALPPVKAILGLAKVLTRETDPNALGLLAISLAYQSALAEAAKEIARNPSLRASLCDVRPVQRLTSAELGSLETPVAFEGFRFETALAHPLVKRADAALVKVADAAGYPEAVRLALLQGVHVRFAQTLRATISDGKVKEKFEPLFRLLQLSGQEVATYSFLRRHLEYQLWRFNSAPALGRSGPMSLAAPLARTFVPLDCGELKWGEIRQAGAAPRDARRSPFDEDFGGRKPLLDTVLSLIRDPRFSDAVVVQGTAGAGKSAFTLQLCQGLCDMGLRPIRVRMRDLSLDPHISLMEDVARALTLNCGDDNSETEPSPRPSAADLDLSHILDEGVRVGDTTMSPYVLIFDGWDEISISASEGFRIRIESTLNAIRRQVLSGHSHKVRVVLTGRPSEDVNQARFLLDGTPILTVRPFSQPQFQTFVDQLSKEKVAMIDAQSLPTEAQQRLETLTEQYGQDEEDPGQSVLGLPLLALLAVWLVLNDPDPPEDLGVRRSSLYRRLVDLTTQYGGNVEYIGASGARITGDELRDLLQRTAAAMTLRGTEHISYRELALRLEGSDLANPDTVAGRAIAEDQVRTLMLSFFFDVGQEGCAFIHKSFREYLFAEAVIAALKRNAKVLGSLAPRAAYWQDFPDGEPVKALMEELGLLLGPQWLQPEVWAHLAWLIGWEVGRTAPGNRALDGECAPIEIQDWGVVRDRLVGLWDWWAEGVHMRPQPYRDRGRSEVKYNPPFALWLAEQIAAPDVPRGSLPEPVRLITLDAHLGDALLRLNCTLHFQINKATGWLDRPDLTEPEMARALWAGAESGGTTMRRYQTIIRQDQGVWLAFSPSSPDAENHYFREYIHRIGAAGWHPGGNFPAGFDFSGVDLMGSTLWNLSLAHVSFRYARLESVTFLLSYISKTDMRSTILTKAMFNGIIMEGLNIMDEMHLDGAAFDGFYTPLAVIYDGQDDPEYLKLDAIRDAFKGAVFAPKSGVPRVL